LGRFLQRLVNQIADGQQLHFNPEASLFKTGESTTPLERDGECRQPRDS
jgi:hypothetical protein